MTTTLASPPMPEPVSTRPTTPLDEATRHQLIDALYKQHHSLLKQLASARAGRYGLHTSWAEDIVHEIFLPLFDRGADHLLVGAPEAVAQYLYTGVEAHCQRVGRSERRHAARAEAAGGRVVAMQPFATPDAILEGDALLELIDCVLARCAPEKAVAYRLVCILGQRQTEVAEQLGVSVRTLAHRLVEPTRRVRQAADAWCAGRLVGAVRASMGERTRS